MHEEHRTASITLLSYIASLLECFSFLQIYTHSDKQVDRLCTSKHTHHQTLRARALTHSRGSTHTHTHTSARAHARTRKHTHTHTLAHTRTHTRKHARTHVHTHAHSHTHARTHAHTRTHAQHTHTPGRSSCPERFPEHPRPSRVWSSILCSRSTNNSYVRTVSSSVIAV